MVEGLFSIYMVLSSIPNTTKMKEKGREVRGDEGRKDRRKKGGRVRKEGRNKRRSELRKETKRHLELHLEKNACQKIFPLLERQTTN